MRVNPKLLWLLLAVVAFALTHRLTNPHRQYSTRQYWESATVASVADVPRKALLPGNRNGGVLMWAAMGTRDPEILRALVRRGAAVNETDARFGGTPMSAAAGKSAHPEMIGVLKSLGADPDQRVNNGETPAMIAAQYNHTPGIIEALAAAGADLAARNHQGKSALELAREAGNTTVEQALLAAIPLER